MASKEQLSALMDGDLEQQGIVDQLRSDEALAGCWQRYHLIGDAMRHELPERLHLELGDRIAAALEQEPAIVAPQPVKRQPAVTGSSPGRVVSLFKAAGQYAIAASVAMAVVIGVQQATTDQLQDSSVLPVLPTLPLSGSASPVSLKAATGPVLQQPRLSEEQFIEQQRRINAYLQDHGIQQRFNAQSQASGVIDELNE